MSASPKTAQNLYLGDTQQCLGSRIELLNRFDEGALTELRLTNINLAKMCRMDWRWYISFLLLLSQITTS